MIQSSVWVRIFSLSITLPDITVAIAISFVDANGQVINDTNINHPHVSLFAPRSAAQFSMFITDYVVAQVNATYGLSITANDVVLFGGIS